MHIKASLINAYKRITGISWGLKSYEIFNFCDFLTAR